MDSDHLENAVADRIRAYEENKRPEAIELRKWEKSHFKPLIEYFRSKKSLRVLSWDEVIDPIMASDRSWATELSSFYERCRRYL